MGRLRSDRGHHVRNDSGLDVARDPDHSRVIWRENHSADFTVGMAVSDPIVTLELISAPQPPLSVEIAGIVSGIKYSP